MRDFTLRKGWVDCDDDRVTKLCTLLYGYKFSRTNKYSDFKDTKDYKPIPSIDQSDYFHPQNSLYRVGDLKVPSNLNELLDKVFRLHNEKREKLLNVAKLYSIASKLWDVSETAAYLTTVNTIESILPTSTEKTCETCGKRLEGLTNKFKEFMDRNASDYDDDELIKVKNKIYRTRGKITHGGILLGEDRNPYWSKPFMDKHATEGHILRCLVRKAIINWFIEW
jgi:hypothetical protein